MDCLRKPWPWEYFTMENIIFFYWIVLTNPICIIYNNFNLPAGVYDSPEYKTTPGTFFLWHPLGRSVSSGFCSVTDLMILDKRFPYHVFGSHGVHTFKAGRNQWSCSVGPLPDVHSSVQNTWMLFLRLLTPTLYSRFSMHPSDSPRYYSHVFHVRLRLHVVHVTVELIRQLV